MFETVLAITIILLTQRYGAPLFLYFLHRIDYALILLWVWSLFIYVLNISFSYQEKFKKAVEKGTLILNCFFIISIFFLDLNIINFNGIIDTYGKATNFLYGICATYVCAILILVLQTLKKDIKNTNNKKYLPLLVLVILALCMLAIRQIYPEIILISFVAAYADLIMFFTIENPDIKMVYELNRNKKLIEDSNEDKLNFLFNISQDIRTPIDNIINTNAKIKNTKDRNLINYYFKDIENNAKDLKILVNNILDASTLNNSNLIITSNTYNIYNLFDSIIKMIKPKINDKIEFRYNISKSLPKEVYGDQIKLKQVIMTILINAIENTKKGFIELTVNEITKYNTCRLIIDIEDSGIGMPIEKVNDLINSSNDFNINEMPQLNCLFLLI